MTIPHSRGDLLRPGPRMGISLALFAALVPALVHAQAAGAPPPGETAGAVAGDDTVLTLILSGGPLMYPIFLCSLVILTVAIERAISLRRTRVGSVELVDEAISKVPSRVSTGDGLEAARAWATATGTLVGRIVEAGLGRLHRDERHAEIGLEEAAAKELHVLQRRLRPFGVVATVAPLLGLLGTVFGLIMCFGDATEAGATERAQKLSDGIYHALVTTAAGLTVAIPAMLLGHFFQGRVDRAIDVVDDAATRFLDHYYGGSDGSGKGGSSVEGEASPRESEPASAKGKRRRGHDEAPPDAAVASGVGIET